MEKNSVLEEAQGLAVLPPIVAKGRCRLRRDREPAVFPEPCQPLDCPVGDPADLGDESPGKLRGTPFGGTVFDRGGASVSVTIATPSQPTGSLLLGQHRWRAVWTKPPVPTRRNPTSGTRPPSFDRGKVGHA